MPSSMIKLYIDGGSRDNPGPAAIGIVVCDENENVLEEFTKFIGTATNNEAEYMALIKGLDITAKYSRGKVICFSDSELLVRQMTGEYRVRKEQMKKLNEKAKNLERKFKIVIYKHMRRMSGHLARADKLLNMTLDRHL